MNRTGRSEIEVSFGSDIAFLDLVQEVSDRIATMVGFEGDDLYWIGLAVREAVTNAVQHGNRKDPQKRVWIYFSILEDRLRISVRDQGEGISEETIPDPLDPENLLKPGGRGIFFVRSFMDNVKFHGAPEGGHEIVMDKLFRSKNQGEDNENRDSDSQ